MKLGIYLRQRCRIYFVAAEHELPSRWLFIAATHSTNSPKMSLFAITIFSVICSVEPADPHVPPIRFQVAARHVERGLELRTGGLPQGFWAISA
jgi:hypothetical protein